MSHPMAVVHETFFGKVASCAGVLGISYGTLLSNTQSVVAILAAIAATVYSVYMIYDLWDRRRRAPR